MLDAESELSEFDNVPFEPSETGILSLLRGHVLIDTFEFRLPAPGSQPCRIFTYLPRHGQEPEPQKEMSW